MINSHYLEMIGKLKDGRMLQWGHIIVEDEEVIHSTVDSILSGMDYRTVNTNRDFATELLNSVAKNGKLSSKESNIIYTLSRYYWVSKVLGVHDIYPTLDDITKCTDVSFVDSILEHTNHMFITILEKKIKKVKGYISSRVHVELQDGILSSNDCSYLDINAGQVRYGREGMVDRHIYPNTTVTVEDMLTLRQKQILEDVSVNNVIQLLITYIITVNHNINYHRLSFRSHDFIDYEKLIGIIKDGTMSDALEYISKLANNIIAISLTAQVNPLGSISNIHVDKIKGKHIIKDTNPVDISTINPSGGLALIITDNNILVRIQHDDAFTNVLEFYIPESTFKGNIDMVVDNLSMGENTRILDIIRMEFDKLGILDLYLQPPYILDISITDFCMADERGVYISKSKIKGEPVYFISDDSINIGYVDGNTFVTVVLIGTFYGELPGSKVMFATVPNVRRVTKKVKSDLRRFFTPEHYEMFRGHINL